MRLGVMLMDISQRAARVVLNRLRWGIASQPFTLEDGKNIQLTVSLAYCPINADSTGTLVQEARQYLQEVRGKGKNVMLEMALE